jgi:hypothetical protein
MDHSFPQKLIVVPSKMIIQGNVYHFFESNSIEEGLLNEDCPGALIEAIVGICHPKAIRQ